MYISIIMSSAAGSPQIRTLGDAICANDISRLDQMLTNGASPNEELESFNLAPLSLVFNDPGCGHPIFGMRLAEVLITHGADVNYGGKHHYTPLMAAMGSCNFEGVKMLISEGADVNAKNSTGRTVLMEISGSEECLPCVIYLIQRGADFKVETATGETALSWARSVGNREVIQFLSSLGD